MTGVGKRRKGIKDEGQKRRKDSEGKFVYRNGWRKEEKDEVMR